MHDLSLHILDVTENALEAGATQIHITIVEDSARNLLVIEIADNGKGMDAGQVARALDPFWTTRKTRRVGLGLPLLAAAARAAEGSLDLRSAPGNGTTVRATFRHDHIDRKPLGDLPATITMLLSRRPDLDLIYRHERDGRDFRFTTEECRNRLDGLPVDSAGVLAWIRDYLCQEETELLTTS